jgi:hypothetical protein
MLSPARPSFVRRHGLGRIPRFVPLPTLSIKLSGTGHGRPELGSCPTERITPAVQDAGFELAVRWTAALTAFVASVPAATGKPRSLSATAVAFRVKSAS